MNNDDKTIIVHDKNTDGATTLVSSSFDISIQDSFASSGSAIEKRIQYDIPFLHSRHNQPFLESLRALYKISETAKNEILEDQSTLSVQKRLVTAMDQQTKMLSELGYENTHVMIVRYIISTFIDESLGSASWSGSEEWSNYSLLGYYYKETYGGEKFFQLLNQFVKDPIKYLEHLKLIYVCLSLGYKGKYSVSTNSDAQLESIRQELYTLIKSHEQQHERFFADHPASTKVNKLTLNIPFKMFILGGFLVLAIVYSIFTSIIHDNEEKLIEKLEKEVIVDIPIIDRQKNDIVESKGK